MIDLIPVAEYGRVFIGSAIAINEDGADRLVSIRLEPNTEDGRVLMTRDQALDVAARLMMHAGDTE